MIPIPVRWTKSTLAIRSLTNCSKPCANASLGLQAGDILVVKHKIVSKSEGRLVDLATMRPSAESIAWAKQYALDARVIELALRESRSVIRRKNGVLITETHHGFLCANSGIDVSNVDGGTHALLLPEDADRSAANLRRALKRRTGFAIPVIITDSFGRPWREGLTEFAIGIAGMKPLRDDRGRRDPHGYKLKASVEAVADELACARRTGLRQTQPRPRLHCPRIPLRRERPVESAPCFALHPPTYSGRLFCDTSLSWCDSWLLRWRSAFSAAIKR